MSTRKAWRMNVKGWTILLIFGAIAIPMVLVACGGSSSTEETGSGSSGSGGAGGSAAPSAGGSESMPVAVDAGQYSSLKGDIEIDGSSTVFPITEAVAEEFGILSEGNVRITVGVSGTGGGFKKFCNGEIQISDASRPIKASEVQLCSETGIEYIEIPVAIDGLTVIVNTGNTWTQCMTVDELRTMWAPESEDVVTRWDQVRPGWPSDKMEMYAPGVDSGTFDYFTETVNGEGGASRGDFTASEDDNLIIQGVSGGKNGVGYLGYSYYGENAGKLKAVEIDGGSGCIAPTDEAINNGAYTPLSRPLFIYVRKDAASTPHIAEFIRYFLGKEGQALAAEVGYIPYPQAVYDLALARFENGTTGTVFGGENPMRGPVEQVLADSQ
ncbi:MAG: PstS family phosphate ABC transporter substrate-binding protein [Chloroflexota bacterium]|nr:PstS family phosphate ABC transporter substrate-binding protein [Chloroflexota bacterium]